MWAESVLRSLKGADRSEGVHLTAFLTGDPSETQTPPLRLTEAALKLADVLESSKKGTAAPPILLDATLNHGRELIS